MADRKKKPEHDDAWWAAQRHAYIEKNDILLSDYPSWEWVSPYDFWRTIFPEGFLQPRGEEVPWHERGGGHPNGIAIQITSKTKTVKTKTGRKHDVPVVERFTLTDDLDGVMERVIDSNRKNESVFCAPVSFFGKSRVAANARFLHAFAIDLDGVGVQEPGVRGGKRKKTGRVKTLPVSSAVSTSLPASPVDPASVVNIDNKDDENIVLDIGDYPIVTDPIAPET